MRHRLRSASSAAQHSLFAAAFACAAFYVTAANAQLGRPLDGRPVTEKDLVGKKICWDTGGFGIFGTNGQWTNSRGRRRPWLVSETGVVKIGLGYIEYQVLPDGSFYAHKFCGRCGSITGHFEDWGKVCN